MLIVGEKEQEAETVSVRQHKVGDKGSVPLQDFINEITEEIKNRINYK